MIEYVNMIKENPCNLCFVDEKSPKEWESLINYKLSEYEESAYIYSAVEIKKMLIFLELNSNKELNSEHIENEKERFKGYYKRILEDIGNSEFYDLYLR